MKTLTWCDHVGVSDVHHIVHTQPDGEIDVDGGDNIYAEKVEDMRELFGGKFKYLKNKDDFGLR